jgi:RNA polymerase sigma-70 factor, ECF subfamily
VSRTVGRCVKHIRNDAQNIRAQNIRSAVGFFAGILYREPVSMCVNDDIKLLEAIRGGNVGAEEAFRTVYRKYSPRVYSYCRRMLSYHKGAYPDDVLQQVFISFFKAVRRGLTIDNTGAFIMTIARNLCYNELSRTRTSDVSVDDIDIASAEQPSYANKELLTLIYEAANRLPDIDKEIILLREQLGYSFDEIGSIVGMSSAAVRQRAHRARLQLKEMLAPYIEDIDNNFRSDV